MPSGRNHCPPKQAVSLPGRTGWVITRSKGPLPLTGPVVLDMGVGAAVALGATVIEKHFTLRRADGGVDSAFSLEPEELALLVTETERAWQALGEVRYGPSEAEKASVQFRRSLYVVRDLKAGDVLTRENVRAIRPGLGLPPKYLDQVLEMTVKRDVKRGMALGWDMLG